MTWKCAYCLDSTANWRWNLCSTACVDLPHSTSAQLSFTWRNFPIRTVRVVAGCTKDRESNFGGKFMFRCFPRGAKKKSSENSEREEINIVKEKQKKISYISYANLRRWGSARFAIRVNRGEKIRMMENFWANKFAGRSLFKSLAPLLVGFFLEWMRMNEATDSEMNAISSAFIIAALRCFCFFLLARFLFSARSAISLRKGIHKA